MSKYKKSRVSKLQNNASRKKLYGGGSGISVAQEQYGVYAPGNTEGAKTDFESMARNSADSMIAYPTELFPKEQIGQKGGAMDVSGSQPNLVKMLESVQAKGGARRRRTGKNRSKTACRKTVRGGKRKLGKALSEWNKSVMKVYRELKSKRKDVKLKDAMKEAKRRKDRGEL